MTFDILTKCLAAYFLCIRLMVICGSKGIEFALCVGSISVSAIAGNIYCAFANASGDEFLISSSTAIYIYVDLLFSLIELYVLIRFIRYKYPESKKSLQSFRSKLLELNLAAAFIIIVSMGVMTIPFSLTFFIEDWVFIDNDFNFYLMFSAIKFALTCHLTSTIVGNVVQSIATGGKIPKNKGIESVVEEKPEIKSTRGLSQFANVSRFE